MGKIATGAHEPYKIIYHVWTWDSEDADDFFDDYDQAISYYEKILKEYGNARLYEQIYDTLTDYTIDNYEERCVKCVD